MGKKTNYFMTGLKALAGSLVTWFLLIFSNVFIGVLTSLFLPLPLVYILLILTNVWIVGFVYNKLWGWK